MGMKKSLNRRMTDTFENMTDHDILISHNVKIDNICNLIRENNKKLDNYIDKLDNRCIINHTKINDQIDENITKNTIKWGIGIVFIIFVGIISTISINQILISKHTTMIQNNKDNVIKVEQELEKNKIFMKSNYKSLIHLKEIIEQ